jgi:creatinine amidohydrolase
MRAPLLLLALALVSCAGAPPPAQAPAPRRGIVLGDLTWPEAEKVLTKDAVVVIPLGAASKEHGRHLRLDNDWTTAKWLEQRVLEKCDVVMAPPIQYHYFPSFVDYPGSTTLRLETARDLVIDIVRSLAHHGPRRFYCLNTGYSTVRALEPAAQELEKEGILLRYSHLGRQTAELEKKILKQARGSHADEAETSILLAIAPDRVDLSKAERDDAPGKGKFSREPGVPGTLYSRTGAWGDPTLATREKGELLTARIVEATVAEIESFAKAALPERR